MSKGGTMAAEYEEMWKGLGLDLTAHDALLQVLGKSYQDIFLSETGRPKGMNYLNFVMSEVQGLRIKELLDGKKEGHKVIGSFCVSLLPVSSGYRWTRYEVDFTGFLGMGGKIRDERPLCGRDGQVSGIHGHELSDPHRTIRGFRSGGKVRPVHQ
jgi:hypothetical protein